MRYIEIVEAASIEKQRVDAQKKQADAQMLAAKKAKQKAKDADLRLKQKESSDLLTKLNSANH